MTWLSVILKKPFDVHCACNDRSKKKTSKQSTMYTNLMKRQETAIFVVYQTRHLNFSFLLSVNEWKIIGKKRSRSVLRLYRFAVAATTCATYICHINWHPKSVSRHLVAICHQLLSHRLIVIMLETMGNLSKHIGGEL